MWTAARHENGLFNPRVTEALALTDRYLGQLMDAARQAGISDSCNFVVLSDHGHLEIQRTVCPNVLLAREGLLRLDGQGNLLDWDAYVQSAGLSAHVFLRDPADAPLRERVSRLLHRLAGEGIYGISRVFTAAVAKEQYQLADGFSFVLEGDGFSAFGEDWRAPFARALCGHRLPLRPLQPRPSAGKRAPSPPSSAWGRISVPAVVLPEGRIVDEAPTLAAAMGLSLPQADGRPIAELMY